MLNEKQTLQEYEVARKAGEQLALLEVTRTALR